MLVSSELHMLTNTTINQNGAHISSIHAPQDCYLGCLLNISLNILALIQMHISRTVALTRTFTTQKV